MSIQLDDRRLWGNEAADDEQPEVLNSFFVDRNEWNEFFDLNTRLSVARARKGMGKSALLRECAFRHRTREDVLVVEIKGSDLVAQKELKNLSAIEHVYDWQQRICSIVNRNIGAKIGFAISDDSIALVETAELSGFKSRNIIGALTDRLRGKIGPIELHKLASGDNKALLGRTLTSDRARVCLLIDDIDATFNATKEDSLRLSTFFTACRELAFNFNGISIRTAVRSDVWATVRKFDEAMDKVEQYIFDLKWSENEFRQFILQRISSYCEEIGLKHLVEAKTSKEILALVFTPYFSFPQSQIPPDRVLRLYTGGRPRWATQLCRMAGKDTIKAGSSKVITLGNIKQVLAPYGRFRLDDVSREHRHQCPMVGDITNCFSKQRGHYSTADLLTFIETKITTSIKVTIDDYSTNDPIEIARFLYRIGFIVAMDIKSKNQREYFSFEEKPELLCSVSNLDDGMQWRIHPSFHVALRLEGGD